MFLFVNYYSDMFRLQPLAIFRELTIFFDMCSLCIILYGRDTTYVIKIIIKIKILKCLKSVHG